jgi:N-methylhydantoinase A/oxoprolinase/acetone carboxylase beta subunit
LKAGFPREANNVVQVGGVRTLFRMPDLLSIGLGGGSLVRTDPLRIGPESVGYRITRQARVFGGDELTASDVAVRAGLVAMGVPERVAGLEPSLVDAFLGATRAMVEEATDRMKTTADPVPLIAVGGGAFLVPERLDGITEVVHVPHQAVANAVGAAIAQISGEIDQIFAGLGRDAALARAREMACERAVEAGAAPDTVRVVEIEDLPIAYLPGDSLRVRCRVVGDIAG